MLPVGPDLPFPSLGVEFASLRHLLAFTIQPIQPICGGHFCLFILSIFLFSHAHSTKFCILYFCLRKSFFRLHWRWNSEVCGHRHQVESPDLLFSSSFPDSLWTQLLKVPPIKKNRSGLQRLVIFRLTLMSNYNNYQKIMFEIFRMLNSSEIKLDNVFTEFFPERFS